MSCKPLDFWPLTGSWRQGWVLGRYWRRVFPWVFLAWVCPLGPFTGPFPRRGASVDWVFAPNCVVPLMGRSRNCLWLWHLWRFQIGRLRCARRHCTADHAAFSFLRLVAPIRVSLPTRCCPFLPMATAGVPDPCYMILNQQDRHLPGSLCRTGHEACAHQRTRQDRARRLSRRHRLAARARVARSGS